MAFALFHYDNNEDRLYGICLDDKPYNQNIVIEQSCSNGFAFSANSASPALTHDLLALFDDEEVDEAKAFSIAMNYNGAYRQWGVLGFDGTSFIVNGTGIIEICTIGGDAGFYLLSGTKIERAQINKCRAQFNELILKIQPAEALLQCAAMFADDDNTIYKSGRLFCLDHDWPYRTEGQFDIRLDNPDQDQSLLAALTSLYQMKKNQPDPYHNNSASTDATYH